MAIPFLNHLDLRGVSELQNAILHKTTSATASDVEGKIIYDTGSDTIKYYNGSTWINLDGSGDISRINITAGDGLTGTVDTTSGDHTQTINVVGGDGITANADEIEVAVDNTTIELSASTGSGVVRAKTAAVANGGTALATGDQIYDFVTGLGYVESVTSGNTNTITLGGTAADPTISANTAAVTDGSANLATGDQIYDFVTGYAASGTNNSTDVTLAGSLDYITISGQVITRNAINLTTDVTGTLPIANGGTGQTTAAAAANALLNTNQGGSLTIGVGTDNIVIPGDLTVTGTTTTNNVEVVSTSNGVIFEGNVADANELTLLAGTLTADRTVTLPDATGTVALTSDLHDAVTLSGSYDYLTISGQAITLNQIDYNTDIANTPTIPTVNNATITLSAGNAGITMDADNAFTTNQSGNETITISHADTSSQSSVNNSGRTYIQDITLDTFGHITGITSATETVTNTDTQLATAAALIDVSAMGANTTASFTHNLASKNLIVQMYDVTTGEVVFADIDHTSNNAISITFAATPTNDIRVVVIDAKNGLTDKTVSYS